MAHDPEEVRRLQLADKRLEGLGIAADDRPAARRTMVAAIKREEEAAAAAHDAAKEATVERDRIRAVARLGIDQGKGRQALRAALVAPVTADAARGLIAAMRPDAEAAPEAFAVPAFVAFGGAAAQVERRRITSAFARPEAAGRFRATVALVLDGDGSLTGEQIAPLLAALPTEAVDPLADFQARVDEGGWFGGGGEFLTSRSETVSQAWSRAVAAANRHIGAAPALPPQAAQQVAAGPLDALPTQGARA